MMLTGWLYAAVMVCRFDSLTSLAWNQKQEVEKPLLEPNSILFENGLGYIWIGQNDMLDPSYVRSVFKDRYKARLVQEWSSTVKDSSKCKLYQHIKTELKLESYLVKVNWKTARYIVKFRTSNHKLAIERLRYRNVELSERKCDSCSLNILGDEYHLLFECTNEEIVKLRRKYIPMYYIVNQSMYNFVKLLSNMKDIKTISKFGTFLKICKMV